MALTAVIVEDSQQASGRYVTVRYDGATSSYLRTRWIADGVDAQAFFDALAARVEQIEKKAELNRALSLAVSGIDPHTMSLHLATTAEMRQFVLRKIVNLVRQEDHSKIDELRNAKLVLDQFTDAQIAAQLENVNATQVGDWRNKMNTLVAGVDQYETGFAEQRTV